MKPKAAMHLSRRWQTTGILVGMTLAQATLADRYVVHNNPDARAPYDTWATAAGDIQTAVEVAYEGDPVWVRSSGGEPFLAERAYRSAGETVWVRAGVYDVGGRTSGHWREALTNRVAIHKAIVVRSEHNNPKSTIIRGAWAADGRTNGPGAVRCVYMADGASLIGFTLTGGATLTMDEARAHSADRCAGGVYAQSRMASVSNCIIVGNAACGDPQQGSAGGGARGGTFFSCALVGNQCPYQAGGADQAVLFHCVVAGNSTGGSGGGIRGGFLQDCLVSNNWAGASGGGVFGADMRGCRVVHNRCGWHGGGAASTDGSPPLTLSECVVAFNHAERNGGGVRMAQLVNCQVFSNTATRALDTYQCSASR